MSFGDSVQSNAPPQNVKDADPMSWTDLTVESWTHFTEITAGICEDNSAFRPAHIWRGQSDRTWPLTSSFRRLLPDGVSFDVALQIETDLLNAFRPRAHVMLPDSRLPAHDDVFSWWAMMQHYGAPTRLSDWTESPFVAAYFAVADHWKADGVVYVAHAYGLIRDAETQLPSVGPREVLAILRNPSTPRVIFPWFSWRMHEREVSQRGRYIYPFHLLDDLDVAIPRILGDNSQRRMIIPAALKPVFLNRLREMNITAASLFPGLDGFGRSLREVALIAVDEVARGLANPSVNVCHVGTAHTETQNAPSAPIAALEAGLQCRNIVLAQRVTHDADTGVTFGPTFTHLNLQASDLPFALKAWAVLFLAGRPGEKYRYSLHLLRDGEEYAPAFALEFTPPEPPVAGSTVGVTDGTRSVNLSKWSIADYGEYALEVRYLALPACRIVFWAAERA